MRRKPHIEEQIIAILKGNEAGMPVPELRAVTEWLNGQFTIDVQSLLRWKYRCQTP
ncbi:MAG: hypothetical protein GXP16_06960 [Gammaproteobacteria bacterium]|nr:hypothetical protein [Gammaproteobacteria bacterium]